MYVLAETSLNVQWDFTADLYLKPTKYSKILKRVIFEMYAYKRIKFIERLKPRNIRQI